MTAAWASVLETHTAALFFAGDRVFKVKKPVCLDFVDLTTREARLAACRNEVALNRRLSPDVYLGVADISLAGKSVDHAVVMRRLPAQASLAARVRDDDPGLVGMVDDIADLLAEFHRHARVVGVDLPRTAWTPPAELFHTEIERLSDLAAPAIPLHDTQRMRVLASAYAAGRATLFDDRLNAGMVRDGHGDLVAADIYLLPDGPRVLDCLEFDERLRVGDVLHDAAFLAMDLERLGRPDLSAGFLRRYGAASGESHPPSLAHYFIAHRALVRAKVALIRQRQLGGTDDAPVRALVELSLRHLEKAQVRLVMVGGLPGAGKTTLAAELADAMGAVHLSSDRVRFELTGPASTASEFDTGRYAPVVTDRVYAELLRRARLAASVGEHVVLDASWSSESRRDAFRRLAHEVDAVPVELHLAAPDAVAHARLAVRPVSADGSEATVEVREQMRARFDPWPLGTVVDTDHAPEVVLAAAAAVVAAVAPAHSAAAHPATVPEGGHP